MIKRLPRFAELQIQSLCATAGALCHSVDEDESGWDRLIEFPEAEFLGPADMRPPRPVAYIQVKSTKNNKLQCKIKLSNALRAAKSPQPWFILLTRQKEREATPRIYAIHIWETLIRRTLEAVRQAEIEGHPLHRRFLVINFKPSDEKNDDLVKWMQSTIESTNADYETAKREINNTVGFEHGYGQGLLTIEAKSEEEVSRNFLGLGDGLRVSSFTFTPSRFGIPSLQPLINLSSGTVRIRPDPLDRIEIRLRNAASSRPIVLEGSVYAGPPGKKLLRFSADFIEIIWGENSECDFRANIDADKQYELSTIESFVKLKEWCAAGPIDLQIWFKGKRAVGGTIHNRLWKLNGEWKSLASVLKLLRTISGNTRVNLSLIELSSTPGLKTIADVLQAPSLKIEFHQDREMPIDPFTDLVFWLRIDIGQNSFCAVIQQPIDEDIIIENGKRRISSNRKLYIDSYTIKKQEQDPSLIKLDYERHIEKLKMNSNPLEIGNIHDFLVEILESQAE